MQGRVRGLELLRHHAHRSTPFLTHLAQVSGQRSPHEVSGRLAWEDAIVPPQLVPEGELHRTQREKAGDELDAA